jgi:hypothetical protein
MGLLHLIGFGGKKSSKLEKKLPITEDYELIKQPITDQMTFAAEALYHSLGYAMNTYIQHLKSEHTNPVWKWASEIERYNVYVVINQMKCFRDTLDEGYLKIAKKRYVQHAIPTASEPKIITDRSIEDSAALLNIIVAIENAARAALKEFNESITHYAETDTIDYTNLPTVDYDIIQSTGLFFNHLAMNANSLYLTTRLQSIKLQL